MAINCFIARGKVSAPGKKKPGPADKRVSHGDLIAIQSGICNGTQLGMRPHVGRGMGFPGRALLTHRGYDVDSIQENTASRDVLTQMPMRKSRKMRVGADRIR